MNAFLQSIKKANLEEAAEPGACHYSANVKAPRHVRVGRIARRLIAMSRELPNPVIARRFLTSCLRYERVLAHRPPFGNKIESNQYERFDNYGG